MKISVITITYNDAAGLARTISSVQSQTYESVEHIIVDGGSTDGTSSLLAQLPESVKVIAEPDEGRYDAMNKGARIASGDFLWFMHAGDVFGDQQVIERVAAHLKPSDVWAYGLSRLVSGGSVVGVFGQPVFGLRRFSLGGRAVSHQAMVVNRRSHFDVGEYDTRFGLAADQKYVLALAMTSAPKVFCDFLCDFDTSGVGSSRSPSAHYRDMRRGRRQLGFVAYGSPAIDTVLTVGLAGRATVHGWRRSILGRIGVR